jgi:heat shock protein beta
MLLREDAFWQHPHLWKSVDIKLMVKRVFITSEFGDDSLPKWASWVKVVVDGKSLRLSLTKHSLATCS